jgi:hypothetical protein
MTESDHGLSERSSHVRRDFAPPLPKAAIRPAHRGAHQGGESISSTARPRGSETEAEKASGFVYRSASSFASRLPDQRSADRHPGRRGDRRSCAFEDTRFERIHAQVVQRTVHGNQRTKIQLPYLTGLQISQTPVMIDLSGRIRASPADWERPGARPRGQRSRAPYLTFIQPEVVTTMTGSGLLRRAAGPAGGRTGLTVPCASRFKFLRLHVQPPRASVARGPEMTR